jgi:hypothetical protein
MITAGRLSAYDATSSSPWPCFPADRPGQTRDKAKRVITQTVTEFGSVLVTDGSFTVLARITG